MKRIVTTVCAAGFASGLLSGCPDRNNITTLNPVLLSQCINSALFSKDQIVFMGPVTYDVGDVWKKNGSGSDVTYDPTFSYASILSDATGVKPEIITGQKTTCSASQNMETKGSFSLGGGATILTALPISASAAAGLENGKVTKITFDSMEIDQVKMPQDYINMYASIPSGRPERTNVKGGSYYWAYAMVKVTNYAVTATYTSSKDATLGASATIPASAGLSGNLNTQVSVTKTGHNQYQYSVPGTVYIAAIMRPFGPGGLPQSGSQSYSDAKEIYAESIGERGR
ncbi:hypothetical protein [Burkholderia sp. BCC1970]|uniref:hypothetical protein n=2 Tax=Burkholderia TaxID=32008 RepID=UPI002ABD401D|nr:hypothetical protein [Burkholderia sp. BCC1970]